MNQILPGPAPDCNGAAGLISYSRQPGRGPNFHSPPLRLLMRALYLCGLPAPMYTVVNSLSLSLSLSHRLTAIFQVNLG